MRKLIVNICSKEIDGKKKISGEAVYMDVKFTFCVHAASKCKKDYSHVLKVNVIDPSSGKILQMGGKRLSDFIKRLEAKITKLEAQVNTSEDTAALERLRTKRAKLRAGERMEELNATTSTYLNNDKEKTIRKALDIVIPKLYGKFIDDIHSSLKILPVVNDLHPRTAFDIYQNDFFCTEPTVEEKTLKGKKKALMSFCDMLNEKPISKISSSDISKVVKSLKGNVKGKINCAEKFFNFCGAAGAFAGPNPITVYKENRPRESSKRKPGSLYPEESCILERDEEKRLYVEVEKDLSNGLGLAVPLGKGFRMSIPHMIELKWKDIVVEDEGIRIRDYKDKYTGGTNNYIRAPTKEAADLIRKKYTELRTQFGKTRLKQMSVLEFPDGFSEKEKKAETTKHIRDILRDAGITKEKIKSATDPNNSKKEGGAGLSLLHKHYDYALEKQGGVDPNSGIGLFLRGMRIYDTTTDSYLCLSDRTGNHFLQTIMRRISGGAEEAVPPKTITEKKLEEDMQEIAVSVAGHDIKTGAMTSKGIFIPKDAIVCIRSDFGTKGIVKFHKDPQKSNVANEYVKIY